MQKNSDRAQYDKWWSEFITANVEDPGTIHRTDLIIKKIKNLGVSSIVDAGCGSGELIRNILSKTKGLNISGFDVSENIIERNKKIYKNIDFFCLNLNENASHIKQFELVVCCEVIEHLKKWQKGIATLSNLVRPGGYIIFTTQAGKIYRHHQKLGHLQHFRKGEIEKELLENNFKIMESTYSGWPFMNLKNILADNFYKKVKSSILKAGKQSPINKLVFKVFKVLYKISSKKKGPQIFILAKKCE